MTLLLLVVMAHFAVYWDSYVKQQKEQGGHFSILGEVGFFGRGGMRVEAYDEQLWCQMLDLRPSVVLLHLGGNDVLYEHQGHIGEMILERVRSLEAVMCVYSRGNIAS